MKEVKLLAFNLGLFLIIPLDIVGKIAEIVHQGFVTNQPDLTAIVAALNEQLDPTMQGARRGRGVSFNDVAGQVIDALRELC